MIQQSLEDSFAEYVDNLLDGDLTRVTDVHSDMHGVSVHVVTERPYMDLLPRFTQVFKVDDLTWSVRLNHRDMLNSFITHGQLF